MKFGHWILGILVGALAATSTLHAEQETQALQNDKSAQKAGKADKASKASKVDSSAASTDEDRARVFVGAGLGVGGYGMVGAEITAGYHYFFPKEQYLADQFRQGVRAYASAGYSYDSFSTSSWQYSYHYVPIMVGVDYTLDFNPQSKFVWGTYVGAGVGFLGGFHQAKDKLPQIGYDASYSYNRFGVAYDVHVGGSLTIANRHRLELDVGGGSSYLSLRYLLLL